MRQEEIPKDLEEGPEARQVPAFQELELVVGLQLERVLELEGPPLQPRPGSVMQWEVLDSKQWKQASEAQQRPEYPSERVLQDLQPATGHDEPDVEEEDVLAHEAYEARDETPPP